MKLAILLGSLMIMSSATAQTTERAIVLQKTINAPVAKVWNAWATADGVQRMLGVPANVELKFGGRYEFLFGPAAPQGEQGGDGNRVLSYVPERMLSFTWNAPPSFPAMRQQRTFVVVTFTPDGEKTKLELRHAGWREGKNWDAVFAYFEKAWPMILGACERHFLDPAAAVAEVPKVSTERDLKALNKLSEMIGGVWAGEIKGPDGPIKVEFRYKRHPDGKGVVGEGIIGKGSANPKYVSNQFGWDPIAKAVYYLDSHDSETVYFGHVLLDGNDLIFTFSPAGLPAPIFGSRARLVDKDTYQTIITNSNGEQMVGFTLKRS